MHPDAFPDLAMPDADARIDAAAGQRREQWDAFLSAALQRVQRRDSLEVQGTLTHVAGLVLEAAGIRTSVGAQCLIGDEKENQVLAEVVGFSNHRAYLMPAGDVHGLVRGAAVTPLVPYSPPLALGDRPDEGEQAPLSDVGMLQLPLGDGLLGRVVDARGMPMDGEGPIHLVEARPLNRKPINAMHRDPVRVPLDTLWIGQLRTRRHGRGQRIGLFAGSGVGKSVLLGMMARYTEADVIVVGLIGERGREVKEFIEDILGADGRARSVVVAAPADAPPLLRMQGAAYASAVAEYFRDRGQHVLLLMDSLTRYAMAQREIGLAIGEPPATKGYPPSCFARLAQLVERSGNGMQGMGSITAIYTVLSEGDDLQDPVADAARAILDGHIVLSRRLAEAGHYPAIDVQQSASRVMHNVISPEHFEVARAFRAVQARYEQGRDLVQLGAYVSGSDPGLDQAIELYPQMLAFLQQGMDQGVDFHASVEQMALSLHKPAKA